MSNGSDPRNGSSYCYRHRYPHGLHQMCYTFPERRSDLLVLLLAVIHKYIRLLWVRIMNDYGHIDNETPSFAISLLKEYRNYGIGTELMKQMLMKLKLEGYKQASLSVQKMNYAVRMYRKVGFEIVDENDEEYIMICKL